MTPFVASHTELGEVLVVAFPDSMFAIVITKDGVIESVRRRDLMVRAWPTGVAL